MKYEQLMGGRGYNSSLPFAVFSAAGDLKFANQRMIDILGLQFLSKSGLKFPYKKDKIQELWPFFNEEKSTQAVYKWMVENIRKQDKLVINVEARLKTFDLRIEQLGPRQGFLVVAKMLRSGDLLEDRESRQTLFRSMSHEIRTAIASLKGYHKMLELTLGVEEKHILEGVGRSIKRLDKVVDRLSDFRSELDKAS